MPVGTPADILTFSRFSVPEFFTVTLYFITSPAFTESPSFNVSFPTVPIIFVSNFIPSPVVNPTNVDFVFCTVASPSSLYETLYPAYDVKS